MKRTFFLTVVLVLAASLAASAASIVNSKHDLGSASTGGGTYKATNVDQTCAFCHVPHNAYTGTAAGGGTNQLVPLWSHTKTATAAFTLYSSPTGTLNVTLGQPAGVSLACLSCHDGTVAVGSLVTTVGDLTPNNNTAAFQITGMANLGTDLSNDHPVSFVLTAADVTADGGLKTVDQIYTADHGYLTNYVSGTSGRIECSSCHKVHDPAISPFLRKSMAQSAMCLDCHIK